MNLLFIGDVFGKPGVQALRDSLPGLIRKLEAGLTVVNVENAVEGWGITQEIAEEVLDLGADCLTTGNHAFDQRPAWDYFSEQRRLLRPHNYPPGCPGAGIWTGEARSGARMAVVSLMGRVNMGFYPDCPFRGADAALAEIGGSAKIIVVDMHAQTTSEKMAMGWHLDGRASAVIGTHTHVATADERVLHGGTAFITDCGMTGVRDSVVGADRAAALRRFVTQMPGRLPAAKGTGEIQGVLVEIDETSGRARSISRVSEGGGA